LANLIGIGVSPGVGRRALEESRVVKERTGVGMDGSVHAVVPKVISSDVGEVQCRVLDAGRGGGQLRMRTGWVAMLGRTWRSRGGTLKSKGERWGTAMVCLEFGVKDFTGHVAGLGRGLLLAIVATPTSKGAGGVVEGVWLVGFTVGAGGEMYRFFWSRFERNEFGVRRDHPQSWCSVGSDHPLSWCSVGSAGCYVAVGQDGGELAEDINFTVSQRGKRGITGGVFEGVDDVISASDDKIDR
jgi:hypothetical protein